jgi:hypothetical protein
MESSLLDLIERLNRLSDQFTDLRERIRKAILLADDNPEMADPAQGGPGMVLPGREG